MPFSRAIAGGVALVLLGVTLLVALSMPVGEGIMTMVFLAFLTVAVLLFVLYGIRMESFRREHPRVGALYSAAECRRANSVFAARLCVGLGAILLGVIACVGLAKLGAAAWGSAVSEYAAGTAVLVGATIGAPLIVYAGLLTSPPITAKTSRMRAESRFRTASAGLSCSLPRRFSSP